MGAAVGAIRLVGAVAADGPAIGVPAHGSAAARSWRVVGLGDSIPAGDGCDGCDGFLDLFSERVTLDTSVPVRLTNLGVGGWTSADLLASLATNGDTADDISGADIVTVTIGANDFNPMLDTVVAGQCGGVDGLACVQPAMTGLERNLTAILERIWELRGGKPTALRVTGYWNVFIDGAVAAHTYGPVFERASSALTEQVNDVIKAVAEAEHARYVDLFTPFKGADGDQDDTELLAPDGDHPSQAGDQRIADLLTAIGYAPLGTGP
jgi:lysophospholipase L1-like esterase